MKEEKYTKNRKKARRKGDAKIPHKKERKKWLAMMEYENLREKEDLGKVGKKHGGSRNTLCLE